MLHHMKYPVYNIASAIVFILHWHSNWEPKFRGAANSVKLQSNSWDLKFKGDGVLSLLQLLLLRRLISQQCINNNYSHEIKEKASFMTTGCD